jgi:hypothetical protein
MLAAELCQTDRANYHTMQELLHQHNGRLAADGALWLAEQCRSTLHRWAKSLKRLLLHGLLRLADGWLTCPYISAELTNAEARSAKRRREAQLRKAQKSASRSSIDQANSNYVIIRDSSKQNQCVGSPRFSYAETDSPVDSESEVRKAARSTEGADTEATASCLVFDVTSTQTVQETCGQTPETPPLEPVSAVNNPVGCFVNNREDSVPPAPAKRLLMKKVVGVDEDGQKLEVYKRWDRDGSITVGIRRQPYVGRQRGDALFEADLLKAESNWMIALNDAEIAAASARLD